MSLIRIALFATIAGPALAAPKTCPLGLVPKDGACVSPNVYQPVPKKAPSPKTCPLGLVPKDGACVSPNVYQRAHGPEKG